MLVVSKSKSSRSTVHVLASSSTLLSSVFTMVKMAAMIVAFSGIIVDGFYVPGVHPISFNEGDDVPVKVNKLTSTHTQVPRDYYKLPFCKPLGGPTMSSENLGEFLSGNKIQNSPYTIQMLKEKTCAKLCQLTLNKLEAS
jgi:transmembrane 9 superfamily member 2/4